MLPCCGGSSHPYWKGQGFLRVIWLLGMSRAIFEVWKTQHCRCTIRPALTKWYNPTPMWCLRHDLLHHATLLPEQRDGQDCMMAPQLDMRPQLDLSVIPFQNSDLIMFPAGSCSGTKMAKTRLPALWWLLVKPPKLRFCLKLNEHEWN